MALLFGQLSCSPECLLFPSLPTPTVFLPDGADVATEVLPGDFGIRARAQAREAVFDCERRFFKSLNGSGRRLRKLDVV